MFLGVRDTLFHIVTAVHSTPGARARLRDVDPDNITSATMRDFIVPSRLLRSLAVASWLSVVTLRRATHRLRSQKHGCTVGIDRDPSRVIPPPRQGGGGTKAPAFAFVVARVLVVVVRVVVTVAGGFVVKCCLFPALLLERCRLRCRSISVNLGTAPSRTTALSLSSQQAHPPSGCVRSWAGLTTHRSSWHCDSSHSFRTFQRIRELLRFICG